MRRFSLAVYGVFGVLGVGLGVIALLMPAAALPPEDYSPLAAHLIREQGALGVFIGLMALWCFLNFDQRQPVHYALLIFAGLFAAVHWAEYIQDRRHLVSPLVNSLPFLALVVSVPRGTRDG